jgi:hypothetical protein
MIPAAAELLRQVGPDGFTQATDAAIVDMKEGDERFLSLSPSDQALVRVAFSLGGAHNRIDLFRNLALLTDDQYRAFVEALWSIGERRGLAAPREGVAS